MPWCHLFLIMPLFGLAILLVFPLSEALPLYLVISTGSVLIYTRIMKTMHTPVATGQEAMIGKRALVISTINPKGLIKYRGELWNAKSNQRFYPGEQVRIVDLEGLRVVVDKSKRKLDNE